MTHAIKNAQFAIVLGIAGMALFLFATGCRRESHVTVTLRVATSSAEQSAFVVQQANSAKFKYLVGKQAGIKPFLAQKLIVKPIQNPAVLEARLEGLSNEEGERYASTFVPMLQETCRTQAQVTLVTNSISLK